MVKYKYSKKHSIDPTVTTMRGIMYTEVMDKIHKNRYILATFIACLIAAIPFMIGVQTGHVIIGFISAAAIYVPSGLYIQKRQTRRHEREKDIIVSALR